MMEHQKLELLRHKRGCPICGSKEIKCPKCGSKNAEVVWHSRDHTTLGIKCNGSYHRHLGDLPTSNKKPRIGMVFLVTQS